MRVLIVRPTALGDVCRTVPALVTLRRAMPDARIDWLVHDDFADAVRHHPDLDDVVTFPRRQLGRTLKTGRAAGRAMRWLGDLRRRRYDLAIDLQGLFRSGLITRLTSAQRRVGYANAREFAWLGYNRRHAVERTLHTVDRMLTLLEADGYTPQRDMRLYVGDEERQWLDGWLQEHSVADGRFACLAPTAKWRCKCWPIEKYVHIAQRLLDCGTAGRTIAVLHSPGEQAQVKALAALGPSIIFPQTTVGQLLALISRTSLLVCNDSAPLHIAVAFDRPIVTIYGPTDPAQVGPYRRDESVVRPDAALNGRKVRYRSRRDDQSLIDCVSVDQVWETLQEQIKGKATRHGGQAPRRSDGATKG